MQVFYISNIHEDDCFGDIKHHEYVPNMHFTYKI